MPSLTFCLIWCTHLHWLDDECFIGSLLATFSISMYAMSQRIVSKLRWLIPNLVTASLNFGVDSPQSGCTMQADPDCPVALAACETFRSMHCDRYQQVKGSPRISASWPLDTAKSLGKIATTYSIVCWVPALVCFPRWEFQEAIFTQGDHLSVDTEMAH